MFANQALTDFSVVELQPYVVGWRCFNPIRAVKPISIRMTNELSGDVVWLKASAYLVEESRTPLEDGATYFVKGHLFMCGPEAKPLLRYECAMSISACPDNAGPNLCPSLTGRGTVVQITKIEMDNNYGDV
jgi:hypothetical protein